MRCGESMTPETLKNVAESLGISIEIQERSRTVETIAALRVPQKRTIWEGMLGSSVRDPDAWRLIGKIRETDLLLLFEEPPLAARVGSAADIVRIVGELPPSVFCVVSSSGVVAFNDHDVLIASGDIEYIAERRVG
jgi:hypothetical protein